MDFVLQDVNQVPLTTSAGEAGFLLAGFQEISTKKSRSSIEDRLLLFRDKLHPKGDFGDYFASAVVVAGAAGADNLLMSFVKRDLSRAALLA